MINIDDHMKQIIEAAPSDGAHCLVGSVSADGWPHIGPKGSVIVFDAQTLAYWERGLATTHANINANPRMSVYYRNSARRDELPRGAGWHFYGMAEIHQGDEAWQAVMARAPKVELNRDPDRKGAAILIRVECITDAAGEILQERPA
jgi:hypothetical protein